MTLSEKLRASVLIETVTNVLNTARETRLPLAKKRGLDEAKRLMESDEAKSIPSDEMEHLRLLYTEAYLSTGAMTP